MKGVEATYEDVAAFLEEHGERYMALMVRRQTDSLRDCRAANERTLREFYELRNRYEPRNGYSPPHYRSPPESDG